MRRLIASVFAGALLFAGFGANAEEEVRFWFHFDNPDNPISQLVSKFEQENPGIKIKAENIPWNTYYEKLNTSIIGGNPPDVAMVKLFALPQLLEMGALHPLDDHIASWDGKADIQDELWELNRASDGKNYYMPLQYVVLYLYYRKDLFDQHGVKVPTNREEFLEAAKKLTLDTNNDGRIDVYGFGMRGAKGGHDHWATFVLPNGADINKEGGLLTPEAIAANQWFIDLHRVHKVFPPSAPNDGFKEITGGFKAGRTAMTIHHIGSSAGMVEALGDKVSAAPVPQGTQGAWTAFGDESTAVFSASKVKDAAFKWVAFLSSGDNNVEFNKASGQLPVTKSGSAEWTLHEKRFVDATVASLSFARTLPAKPQTSEFVGSSWPTNMQRALLGEISAEEMLRNIDNLYFK